MGSRSTSPASSTSAGITRFNVGQIIFAFFIVLVVAAISFVIGAVARYALRQRYVARLQASGLGQRAALDGTSPNSA